MKPIELSLEFFPPKTAEGADNLRATRAQLLPLKPKFVSVTFGAGGSTQQGTLDTVLDMQKDGLSAAPHCRASARRRTTCARSWTSTARTASARSWRCAATCPRAWARSASCVTPATSVRFIRAEHGDWFHLGSGRLPGIPSAVAFAEAGPPALRRQGEGRARISAITQYFFNADAYFRFVDDAARLGVEVPIVPGIMPITNYSQLMRFSEMCGAEVPRWIARRLESFGDDRESIRAFGGRRDHRDVRPADQAGACRRPAFLHAQPGPRPRAWSCERLGRVELNAGRRAASLPGACRRKTEKRTVFRSVFFSFAPPVEA